MPQIRERKNSGTISPRDLVLYDSSWTITLMRTNPLGQLALPPKPRTIKRCICPESIYYFDVQYILGKIYLRIKLQNLVKSFVS